MRIALKLILVMLAMIVGVLAVLHHSFFWWAASSLGFGIGISTREILAFVRGHAR